MRRSKPEAWDEAECTRVALGLLARREHSRYELETKLTKRGAPRELIATVLDALEQSRALAADRFVESFIRSRAAKGQGPARIRAELARRGIAEADAAALIAESGIDWQASAQSVRAKRFGLELPRDYAARARQARFLEYRGFDQAAVRAALDFESGADDIAAAAFGGPHPTHT